MSESNLMARRTTRKIRAAKPKNGREGKDKWLALRRGDLIFMKAVEEFTEQEEAKLVKELDKALKN